MGLRALLSPEHEPLDLWLSARHSGRRLLGPRPRGATGAAALGNGPGLLIAPAPGAVEELVDASSAPAVFVTHPRQDTLCPACQDVLYDPVICATGETRCRECAPLQPGQPPLQADIVAASRVACLPTLCRFALTRDSAGRVWLDASAGCRAHVPLATLAQHELRCGGRPQRCCLPGGNAAGTPRAARCGVVLPAAQMAVHQQAECPLRPVPCPHAGCFASPAALAAAAHAAACSYGPAACPAPACAWRGLRGALAEHAAGCAHAPVACRNADLEPPAEACTHVCSRGLAPAHAAICDFRMLTCEACGHPCAARRMPAHVRACALRVRPCPQCNAVRAAPCQCMRIVPSPRLADAMCRCSRWWRLARRSTGALLRHLHASLPAWAAATAARARSCGSTRRARRRRTRSCCARRGRAQARRRRRRRLAWRSSKRSRETRSQAREKPCASPDKPWSRRVFRVSGPKLRV